jgi:hypothetical protein
VDYDKENEEMDQTWDGEQFGGLSVEDIMKKVEAAISFTG